MVDQWAAVVVQHRLTFQLPVVWVADEACENWMQLLCPFDDMGTLPSWLIKVQVLYPPLLVLARGSRDNRPRTGNQKDFEKPYKVAFSASVSTARSPLDHD